MCVHGSGLVGKTLLHRVGMVVHFMLLSGLPLWGVIHPTVEPAPVPTGFRGSIEWVD